MSSDTWKAGAADGSVAAAVSAGEWVLASRFGSTITLSEPEDLAGSGPATVVRVRVASSPFSLPKTLVVKHYPDKGARGLAAFATEAAGYQLFTALSSGERMCPEPIGHDADRRTLVLSDLGRAPTLEDKLYADGDRAAEKALLSWSRALGKMHATTARREADFNALLRRFGVGATSNQDRVTAAGHQLPPLLAELGVETPDEVKSQVTAAEDAVYGGRLRAFSPVDLAPDNNLVTGSGVRFLDFEHCRVRNVLIDVAHLRAPFAFWSQALALPAGMSEAMIAAWRSEVRDVWPQFASDETFTAALLDSQLVCVWTQTLREMPDLTAQRAAALQTCWRDLAGHAGAAGADLVAEHADEVATALDKRFGPGLHLDVYPAFTTA